MTRRLMSQVHGSTEPEATSSMAESIDPADAPTLAQPARDATSADLDDAEIPPMLREPTHLPRQPRAKFSPEQFYALSRVLRTDVDAEDEGLWLTEEACPTINPEGILFDGTLYWDPGLQPLIDVGRHAPKRTFVIRYNRALYARGVLDEIIVLEKLADRYEERCRCRPPHLVSQVDLNRVMAERERFKKQLLAKIAHAHGVRITLEQGDRALQELRDEQARQARLQRQTKRAPIAAAPIDARSAREAAQARHGDDVRRLSDRLGKATGADRASFDDDPPPSGETAHAGASSALAASGGKRRRRREGATGRRATEADAPVTGTGHASASSSTLAEDADSSPVLTPVAPTNLERRTIADYLRAESGFLGTDEED